jgi:large subunit ribosomal protein L29
MKAQNYREMSKDELLNKVEELRKHLFELKSQAVTETLEDSKSIINTRREIARILTVAREKELKENNK